MRITIRHMNIQKALQELNSAGLTDEQIGERIGAPQATVTRLRNGTHATTSYERGEKIISLHKEVVKQAA